MFWVFFFVLGFVLFLLRIKYITLNMKLEACNPERIFSLKKIPIPFSIISSWKVHTNFLHCTCTASLPLIKEVMPRLFTKILSSSSFPVNSSATTNKSARNFLAVSSMYCKKHSQKSHRKGKGRHKRGQISKLGRD